MNADDLSQIPDDVRSGKTTPESVAWYTALAAYIRRRSRGQVSANVERQVGTTAIVQDVIGTIAQRVGTFESRGKGSFRGWANLLLRRHASSYGRRLGAFRETTAEGISGLPGDHEPVDRPLVMEETFLQIGAIMKTLDPKDQTIINLRILEGKKYEEIAEAVGLSVSTVQKRFEKAMEKLRGRLGPEGA